MITLKVKKANILGAIRGLIGKKPYPLLFKTRLGIHTFGTAFAIDIIVLDKYAGVVGMKSHLVPNRLFFWNPRYDTIIELPDGIISKLGIKRGDKIVVKISR